jgi:hypothetical protein
LKGLVFGVDLERPMGHAGVMGGQLMSRRPLVRRPSVVIDPRDTLRANNTAQPEHRILQLQRQAGNQAVAQLLTRQRQPAGSTAVQRKATTHPENPPITARPAGSLTDQQWTAAYRAATDKPSAGAYAVLFRDIALAAGMTALGAGFVPATVPASDGKTARPGLNMNLDPTDEPGHTGWVDKSGAFGVPLTVGKAAAPSLSVAIILSPTALAPEKELSLRTARHEMVHARHKLKVLDALAVWQKVPARRRPDFQEWLRLQSASKKMSALDVALIGKGAQNGVSNTEVLAYVEGFTTDFHRRPATEAGAWMAFFELLGVVETRKVFPWKGAEKAVQGEALARLREYHATLPVAYQRLWKQWLDKQLAGNPSEKDGRKDFLTRLTAFVT